MLKSIKKHFQLPDFFKKKQATSEDSGQAPSIGRLQRLRLQTRTAFTLWHQKICKFMEEWEPQNAINTLSQTLQRTGASHYGKLLTIILSTYFFSDVTAMLISKQIPPPPSASGRFRENLNRPKTAEDFSSIVTRNLFNSRGLIPGEETPGNESATRTRLPISLVGTLVLSDSRRSVATLEDRSINMVYALQEDDQLVNKLKVLQVEAKRMTFLNLATGRKEFVEITEDANSPSIKMGAPSGGIEKVAQNQFNVSRSEVDRALADFNNILTQARAIPYSESGVPSGYVLSQIVPGSIYDRLGLKDGDIISGLNGQPINDPGKAFEMLSELKTANHLELQVKKNGKQSTYTYEIH